VAIGADELAAATDAVIDTEPAEAEDVARRAAEEQRAVVALT
jgi:hypothetical protein